MALTLSPGERRTRTTKDHADRPFLTSACCRETKRVAMASSQGGCSVKRVLRLVAFAGKLWGAGQGEEDPSGERPAGAQTRGDEDGEQAGRGGGRWAESHRPPVPVTSWKGTFLS